MAQLPYAHGHSRADTHHLSHDIQVRRPDRHELLGDAGDRPFRRARQVHIHPDTQGDNRR